MFHRAVLVIGLATISACQSTPTVVTEPDGGTDAEAARGCVVDEDCDDGLFCNGAEACRPGATDADGRGCVDATEAVCARAGERCDEDRGSCVTDCAVELDADGDGRVAEECGGDDCDDHDANRFPGNVEVCDGEAHDEDCNEGTFGFLDADGDGSATSACCNAANCGDDCNDADSSVSPSAGDVCDGIDNDCSGTPDEGCPCRPGETAECGTEAQRSRIGICTPGSVVCVMGTFTDRCAGGQPPLEEICAGDERDEDCDGMIDEHVTRTYFVDADGDGFGTPVVDGEPATASVTACSVSAGYASNDDDCDDSRASTNPANPEVCNGTDDDCDGETDEGYLRAYYRDSDGDGFGDPSSAMTLCAPPDGYVLVGTDCDDTSSGASPAAFEVCNSRDDDCDTRTDEGVLRTYFRDTDGDGYGLSTATMTACTAPADHAERGGDCDDAAGGVSPSATELCNGIDDNCRGGADEGCSCRDGTTRACAGGTDVGECNAGTQLCIGGTWQSCVGQITAVAESCNGRDDDCDASTDESVLAMGCLVDADTDGYGAGLATTQCRDATRMSAGYCPMGYTATAGDCNDGTSAVRPMATEACNVRDDDCDARTDEGTTVACYFDGDGDGWGSGSSAAQCPDPSRVAFGTCPSGWTHQTGDCNDGVGTVRPGGTESCNGVNDDCDAMTDEGLTATGCYPDVDGDLYGALGSTASTQCRDASRGAYGFCPVGYVNAATDCNDTVASVRPGAAEGCNLRDDDCDTRTDEGALSTYYRDADSDAFGTSATTLTGCSAPAGYVAVSGDCNDASASICPGAPELCDSVDQNCTMGTTDEPRRTFYRDMDGDFYGASSMTMSACTVPVGYTEYSGDCNDTTGSVRPGATELCNATNDDCDGTVDEGAAVQCSGLYPFAVNVASWSCAGSCGLSCSGDYGNCDTNLANGCEVDRSVSALHCGACGNSCGWHGTCASSTCDSVIDISAGGYVTCMRRSSGVVACWGAGTDGQLAEPSTTDSSTPFLIEEVFGVGGIGISHAYNPLPSLTGNTVWVWEGRNLIGWGYNLWYQVGDGTSVTPRTTPHTASIPSLASIVQVVGGHDHACALMQGLGEVLCWGTNNDFGELGGTAALEPSVVQFTGFGQLSAGNDFNCGILNASGVRCWGARGAGRLGDGLTTGSSSALVTPSLPVGFTGATSIASGTAHTCVTNGTATYCWGGGTDGQLGNGAFANSATPVSVGRGFVQIVAGARHSCGRTSGGLVYCWGDDSFGAVGLGATADQPNDTLITGPTGVIDLAAGEQHTCALESDGDLWCWGRNTRGELGDGTTSSHMTPYQIPGF